MKPITVTTTVPRPREEVFAFLDVLGNHEPFTNHMLVDWSLSGPREESERGRGCAPTCRDPRTGSTWR